MQKWTEVQQREAQEMLSNSTITTPIPSPPLKNLDEDAKFLFSMGFILRYEISENNLLSEQWLWKDGNANIPAIVHTMGGWIVYDTKAPSGFQFICGHFRTAPEAFHAAVSRCQQQVNKKIQHSQEELRYLDKVLRSAQNPEAPREPLHYKLPSHRG